MPRQLHKIEQFHGGLNTNSDARDILPNEISEANDVNVSDLGKIKLLGEFSEASEIADLPTTGIIESSGAFNYSVDNSSFASSLGASSSYIQHEVIMSGTSGHRSEAFVQFSPNNITEDVDDIVATFILPNDSDSNFLIEPFIILNDGNNHANWNRIMGALTGGTMAGEDGIIGYPSDDISGGDYIARVIMRETGTTYNGASYVFTSDSELPFISTVDFHSGADPTPHQVIIRVVDVVAANYTLVAAGVSNVYLAIAGDTTDDIATALETALNANPIYFDLGFEITRTGSDITLSKDSFFTSSCIITTLDNSLLGDAKDDYTIFVSNEGEINVFSHKDTAWHNIGNIGRNGDYNQVVTPNPNFYLADGTLRISDSQFDNNSRPSWYGKINRNVFNFTEQPHPVIFSGLLSSEIRKPSGTIKVIYSTAALSEVEYFDNEVYSANPNQTDNGGFGDSTNYSNGETEHPDGFYSSANQAELSGGGELVQWVYRITSTFQMNVNTDAYPPGGGHDMYFIYSGAVSRMGQKGEGTRNFRDNNYYNLYSNNNQFYYNGTYPDASVISAQVVQNSANMPVSVYDFAWAWSIRIADNRPIGPGNYNPPAVTWSKYDTVINARAQELVPVFEGIENSFHVKIGNTIIQEAPEWASQTENWEVGASFVYDEKQESLVTFLDQPTMGLNIYSAPFIQISTDYLSWNPRVTSIKIYLRQQGDRDWLEFVEASISRGAMKVSGVDGWHRGYWDSGGPGWVMGLLNGQFTQSIPYFTYSAATGQNQDEPSLFARYKTGVVANRTAYVGNVKYIDSSNTLVTKEDAILKSPVNKFDIFSPTRRVEAIVNDGDEIIKLEEFADRLLQFKKRKLVLINVSQEIEFLESVHDNLGIPSHAASVRTEFGVVWANSNGAYIYNGSKISPLLEKDGRRLVDESDWESFATDDMVVSYFPNKKHIIVIGDACNAQDIFVYDLVIRSWVKGIQKFGEDANPIITNTIVNKSGDLILFKYDNTLLKAKKWIDAPTSDSSNFSMKTKDIDFGQPGQAKKIYKVIITHRYAGTDKVRLRGEVLSRTATSGQGEGEVSNDFTFGNLTEDTGHTGNWITEVFTPPSSDDFTSPLSLSNIYSMRLYLQPVEGYSVPAEFEVNDISIVYRLKTVK